MQVTKQIGKHDFHRHVTVLEVPKGTLAIRDKDWQEHGWNHGSSHVKVGVPAWDEIYAQAMADHIEEDPQLGAYSFATHFYIIREGDRKSCGCISRDAERGMYTLTG